MTTRAFNTIVTYDPDLDCLDSRQNDWTDLLSLIGTLAYTLIAVCSCV